MRFVIAYDIVNDRARRRVVKVLEKRCRRVQKSVFRFSGASSTMELILKEAMSLIEPDDSLAVWSIGRATSADRYPLQSTARSEVACVVFDGSVQRVCVDRQAMSARHPHQSICHGENDRISGTSPRRATIQRTN